MATVELVRQANSPEILFRRFKAQEPLSAGSLTKILHLIPDEQQAVARETIRAVQQDFWQTWAFFRGGLESDRRTNFYHVVGRLPVLKQFSHFIDPQPRDLIVDLAGGSAAMAPHFDKGQIAGYLTIDNNPLALAKAKEHLSHLGHPINYVLEHDLTTGLPPDLDEIIASIKPLRVRYISNWGISYFDADRMSRLMQACLGPDVNQGIPSTVDFNMLTNGKFDPRTLAVRFMMEVTPQHLVKGKIRPLLRAFRAIPPIIQFGKALPGIAPIWYPSEIRELLAERGLMVTKEDSTLLWGQSTAIKVNRKVPI